MKRPKHQTSRAFLSAYLKGRLAAKDGHRRIPPYEDLRGGRFGQITTWSRSFRNYWLEGYDHQRAGIPIAYTASQKKKENP